MSEILETILRPIFEFVFVLVGYWVGWIVLLLLTFGFIQPGPLENIGDKEFRTSVSMAWWHLTYVQHGQIFLPAGWVVALGLVSIASVVVLVWSTT